VRFKNRCPKAMLGERPLSPSPLIVQLMLELARSSGQGSCEGAFARREILKQNLMVSADCEPTSVFTAHHKIGFPERKVMYHA